MLEDELQRSGFACRMCAKCCSGPDNEVMVSPDEVDVLSAATGLSFAEIAEPYPEWFTEKSGGRFTLGWFCAAGLTGTAFFSGTGAARSMRHVRTSAGHTRLCSTTAS
jgi:hypothetical protein